MRLSVSVVETSNSHRAEGASPATSWTTDQGRDGTTRSVPVDLLCVHKPTCTCSYQ